MKIIYTLFIVLNIAVLERYSQGFRDNDQNWDEWSDHDTYEEYTSYSKRLGIDSVDSVKRKTPFMIFYTQFDDCTIYDSGNGGYSIEYSNGLRKSYPSIGLNDDFKDKPTQKKVFKINTKFEELHLKTETEIILKSGMKFKGILVKLDKDKCVLNIDGRFVEFYKCAIKSTVQLALR